MAQITTAFLTCGQCEYDFPLNVSHKPESITCPFCQNQVAADMIDSIYTAVLGVADLNYHFQKYASERNENLFSLSVEHLEVALPVDNN